MKTKLAYGILAASLVAIPAYGEGEEGEGQETVEHVTSTIRPGGTRYFLTPGDWDVGEVPNAANVDVVIDGDPDVSTAVNFFVGANTSYTNGTVTIDAGDTLTYKINDNSGSSSHNWWVTSITNRGSFIIDGRLGKNDQKAWVHAEEAPFYNAERAVVKVQNATGGYRGAHYLRVPLDGSVNKGEIEISGGSNRATDSQLNLLGAEGGAFQNDGTILVRVTGNATTVGTTGITYSGPLTLLGTGSICLDNDYRDPSGAAIAQLVGPGMMTPLTIGAGQTVFGDGNIMLCYLHNYGIIRSEGTNTQMKIQMTSWRDAKYAVTNEPSGCIIANSKHGILMNTRVAGNVGERPGWNTRFINLGLLESRTGSRIQFCDGINTSSAKTGDSDLNDYDGAYLELWGRVAGGGEFVTRRRIYIADGAKLMPGDLANTDGTGESTCGTITFPRLVLRGPAAIADSEETTSGAITEFQCRKPVAGKYDSVWVNGDATVAGTLKFLENPSSGTYPLFTSTGTLTCDLKTLKIECAQGVKAPKLKLVESTYPVEEEVWVVDGEGNPVMDAETGLQVTETKTVDYPCQRIEATWMNGFTITLR